MSGFGSSTCERCDGVNVVMIPGGVEALVNQPARKTKKPYIVQHMC
jgi:hypothetical protein